MSLVIRKKSTANFWHYFTIDGNDYEYAASDITIIVENNRGKLRSITGREIALKDGYTINEIVVYDDSTSGGAEQFVSFISLFARLVALGYPAFVVQGQSIATAEWGNITGNIQTQADLIALIGINNKPIENRYATLSAMLADQANQTTGFINQVDDPLDAPNSGYYDKLPTSNAEIEDYKKLTNEEVSLIQSNIEWQVKTITDIQTSFANYDDLANGEIWAETDNTNITHLIFDKIYTQILEKARVLFGAETFYLNIYNVDKNTNIRATWTSLSTVGASSEYLRVAVSGVTDPEIKVGEVLHLGLPINVGGGGTTPTIQEVLTEGNEVNEFNSLNFRGGPSDVTAIQSFSNSFIIFKQNTSTDSNSSLLFTEFITKLGQNNIGFGTSITISKDNIFISSEDGSGGTVIPNSDFNGLSYGADYSANYTERSIPDKAYVDQSLTTGYTVATLPTGTTGQIAHVTDASAITYRAIATGGGADVALVMFDGTNWIYH